MRHSTSPVRIDFRLRSAQRSRRSWLRRGAPLALLAALGAVVGTGLFPQLTASPGTSAAQATLDSPAAAPAAAAQGPSAVIEVKELPATAAGFGFDSIEIVVRNNDSLDRIFRRLRLDLADLAQIRQLPGLKQALDALRPGDEITVTHHEGAVEGLFRQINESQTLSVTRGTGGYLAEIIENPVETQLARQRVRIASSLFEAATAAGVSDQTALAIANVFGWDIDFVLDVRAGDEFTVVYEKISQDGVYLRDGPVLAAEFINDGRSYRAVRYTLPDGKVEYFTPEGRSVHRAFLRAPVDFTRISSRFNPRRRHPVLNRIRAHNGVDYAAPTGTPVRAAGDGRIRFRGTKGGYGRVVELDHGGSISTLYGHLSRFAKATAAGQRVTQGQVIGYVGASGLATGPHLHYEYRLNGVHRNPQTVPLPAAQPIAAALREDFAMHAAPLVAELELTKSATLLARR